MSAHDAILDPQLGDPGIGAPPDLQVEVENQPVPAGVLDLNLAQGAEGLLR